MRLPNDTRTLQPKTSESSAESESAFSLAMVEHLRIIVELHTEQAVLEEIALRMTASLRNGGKILFCGNGGSAADAQHLAAELVGRFQLERRGLAAVALTTDTSVLTSIANDYGYDQVFQRQVEALACPGDVLVGLSTSGGSENVCAAVTAARLMDVYTVAMCGAGGGRLAQLADVALRVPSDNTARIQEAHIFCGHVLCASVEASLQDAAASSHLRRPPMPAQVTALSLRGAGYAGQTERAPTSSRMNRRMVERGREVVSESPTPGDCGRTSWQMQNDSTSHRTGSLKKWL